MANNTASNTDIARELAQLKQELAQLKGRHGVQDNENHWLAYGEFSRRNAMSRTRINRLIAAGKIICDKSLGDRAYLYKWV